MKIYLYFLILIALSSSALALSINNTLVSSVGLNTSFAINKTMYCNAVETNSNNIFFDSCSRWNDSDVISINYTTSNKRYYLNNTQYDYPYISASSTVLRVISSNLTESNLINYSTIIPCGLQSVGYVKSLVYTTASPTTVITSYNCNEGTVSFTNIPVMRGQNTLGITLYSACTAYQDNNTGAFSSVTVWLVIFIAMVFIVGLVLLIVAMIKAINTGEMGQIPNLNIIISVIVFVFIIGMICMTAVLFFSQFTNAGCV